MKKAILTIVSVATATLLSAGAINKTSTTVTMVSAQEAPVTITRTQVEIVSISHKVESGETISSISEAAFGAKDYVQVIFDQNKSQIENTAQSHGFVDSDSGHWIFPGEEFSISYPVIRTVVESIPAQTEAAATVTSTATVTLTSTSTPSSTQTQTSVPMSTNTEVLNPTQVASSTPTPTVTVNATVTVSPTPAPSFTFSPLSPVDGVAGVSFYISTYFGQKTAESPHGHRGIDIAESQGGSGFPIKAIEAGGVIFAGKDLGGYGYSVVLLHPDGHYSRYAHLEKEPLVGVNDLVAQGQVIGYLGDTGYSTGPHLHLEIWDEAGTLEDPLKYFHDESAFNVIPTPAPVVTATAVVVPKVEIKNPLVNENSEFHKQMDQIIWTSKAEENLRNTWIWNSAVAANQKKLAEDLAMVSFFLLPMGGSVPNKTYTVQSGDTLGEIADAAKIDASQLVALNNLSDPNQLAVGQVLQLPPGADEVKVVHRETLFSALISYPDQAETYVNYLRSLGQYFGADVNALLATMACENYTYNPNIDYIDSDGTETAGVAQFKVGTYRSAAIRMGLPESEIASWKDPFNQLKVMAWKFAVGEAGAWTGYRNLVNYGRCRV